MPVASRLLRVALPDTVLLPLQASDAMQLVVLVEDQRRVEDAPLEIDVGFALRLTVGAGTTEMVTVLLVATRPGRLQLKMYLLLVTIPLTISRPAKALLPLQAPDAMQLSAPMLRQPRVVCPPAAILDGLPLKTSVAANALPPQNTARPTNKVLSVVLIMTSLLRKIGQADSKLRSHSLLISTHIVSEPCGTGIPDKVRKHTYNRHARIHSGIYGVRLSWHSVMALTAPTY